MKSAKYLASGKCTLCGHIDEGYQIPVWGWIKVFVCEVCWSSLFKGFHKDR